MSIAIFVLVTIGALFLTLVYMRAVILGIVVIVLIWVFIGLSLRGVGIITSVAGWFDFDPSQFTSNWNVGGKNNGKAIMSGFAILIILITGT